MNTHIRLDHATVCGHELELLRRSFADAGLETDYGGPHANGVTHMALLGFGDGSYLELIAPLKPGITEDSHWGGMMAANAGGCAWAIAVDNIQAEVSRFRALGIETKGPFVGSRKRPDGKILEWEIASVGPGEPGALLPFMIQDHTPREWRVQPSLAMQGYGLNGIAAVVLQVEEIDVAAALFGRAFEWPAPLVEKHAEFGASIACFAETPVMLAAPLDKDSWLAKRLQEFGARPAAFLLGTRDLDALARHFQLSAPESWFGRELAWLSEAFSNLKLGMIAEQTPVVRPGAGRVP